MSSTDPTFRTHTSDSANSYHKHRPAYPSALYEHILAQHTSTSGQLGTVVDVGCGTGRATRELAKCFDRAVGVDPGEEMVEVAKAVGGKTRNTVESSVSRSDEGSRGREIEYVVAEAEKVTYALDGEDMELEGQVDMVTAAMAAHWFDLPRFYVQAARLLRPGGTLVFWTSGSMYPHPTHTPHADEVHSILQNLETVELAPYELPPNRKCRELYATLPLPWNPARERGPSVKIRGEGASNRLRESTVSIHQAIAEETAEAFPQRLFVREIFDAPDPPSASELNLTLEWKSSDKVGRGEVDTAPDFLGGSQDMSLKELGDTLGTGSMVVRWREDDANAEREDCVWRAMREIARVLVGKEASDGFLENTRIRVGSSWVVMMFTRAG
ncbi:MAG: hypothetical protein M1831_004322 [Alyxoria varia]|nr:MAG: hypothetical protein M1831_004322 [Alyxoria varia]